MRTIAAIAIKDLRLLLRDRIGFFFTFFFPLLYATFFGAIFSGAGGTTAIKIAIVDEDQTDGSRTFIRELDESDEIDATTNDRQEASDLVRRGRRVAYIVLPAGFGKAHSRPFAGETMKIEIGLDPGRKAESGLLQGVLTKHMYQGIQEAFTDREKMRKQVEESLADVRASQDIDPMTRTALELFLPALSGFLQTMPAGDGVKAAFQPFEFQTTNVERPRSGPRTSYDISFPQGIIWATIGCAAAFGISLVTERAKGTLVRLRIAPIARAHILGGKALACFATTFAAAATLIAFAIGVFGVRPNSPGLLAVGVVCVSLCFVGVMMLLSVLGRTEQSAAGIGWAILMVMAMTGGGMVPVFFMPSWMQPISHASPVKWAVVAMEGAIWRGFSVSEMILPCGILLAVGLVGFLVGARAFRWLEQG